MHESPISPHPPPTGDGFVADPPETGDRKPVLVSIVTVSWNGRDLVRRHLEALDRCRQTLGAPLEVILVDNASADGTPAMVEREFPWVLLIRNAENLGFAMGCRQGLERARGEYLLLLNPDCEANTAALAAMIDHLRAHPGAGAVGCRLLHADGTPQRSAYHDHTPFRYILYHSALSPILHGVKRATRRFVVALGLPLERWQARRPPRRCDWLMGACILVHRRVRETVGALDPAYFMYSEDADWCRRIRAAGFDIWFLPGHAILHRQKQSSARSREFTYVRLYRSLLMLCLRFMNPDQVLAMRRVVLADMALRRLLFPLLAKLRPSRAEAHHQRLRATRRVAEIWRRLDPAHDPDPPPAAPAKPPGEDGR